MLMRDLCTSPTILELLSMDGKPLDPKTLPYTRVYPFEYAPDVEKDSEAIICFQVTVPFSNRTTGAVKSLYIDTFAIAEQSVMRGKNGMVIDVLSSEIDKLLNGSLNYGLGKMELVSSETWWPITTWHGRRNRYFCNTFNRLCGNI